MFRLVSLLIIFLKLIVFYSSSVAGYNWIHVKPGSQMPTNAVPLSFHLQTYFGRARHYNEVLPAEVYNSTTALVYTCSKVIKKRQFEILVDAKECSFKEFSKIEEVQENVVRIGNTWNGEPSYLGYTMDNSFALAHIASILLTSNKILKWKNADRNLNALVCNDVSDWLDVSSDKLPKYAVSGGKSRNDSELYVARLKVGCDILPGQVIESLGIATALHDGEEIQSVYSQVLIGDNYNYSWVSAENGEIPDFAVVAATSKSNEFMYVARMNQTLGYVVHSFALNHKLSYEILVKDKE